MEILLGKVTQQAMNYAIRSGITITASYAFRQSSRLLQAVEGNDRQELQILQEKLKTKLDIIAPAIDMIELIAARGNTSLESAVSLTKSIRLDIQNLGQKIKSAAEVEEKSRRGEPKARNKAQVELILKKVIIDIKKLLNRLEDAVPLVNLAITTSGVKLSTSLPSTVSPSRLLQASTFLTAGDNQYATLNAQAVQIGPTFTLSLYMLFAGHVRPQTEEDVRASTWKEVMHKTRLKLMRIPIDRLFELPDPTSSVNFGSSTSTSARGMDVSHMSASSRSEEFAYQIVIVEDLDDDRVHTYEEEEPQPGRYDDIEKSGLREAIPVHEISKIFYADTGKILNIGTEGETNNPILLLKRDLNAIPPRRLMEQPRTPHQDLSYNERSVQQEHTPVKESYDAFQSEIDAQLHRESRASSLMPPSPVKGDNDDLRWRIPRDLDPEWLAFEVYTEEPDSESDSETSTSESPVALPAKPTTSRSPSIDPNIASALSNLDLNRSSSPQSTNNQARFLSPARALPQITTSLSLLETLIRLISLQQFQQTSHLAIPDELLNFFLSEAATTGAATGDEIARRRLRHDARLRVGFDPYDESPIKRRGEEYQYRGGTSQRGDGNQWQADEQGWHDGDQSEANWASESYDEGYATYPLSQSPSTGRPASARPASYRQSYSPRPSFLMGHETPARETVSDGNSPRTPSPLARTNVGRMKTQHKEAAKGTKKGSPLARPVTPMVDEGIVVSPPDNEGRGS